MGHGQMWILTIYRHCADRFRPVAIARDSEAAVAAHGQLQCRICCSWGQRGILPPAPSRINLVWGTLSARAASESRAMATGLNLSAQCRYIVRIHICPCTSSRPDIERADVDPDNISALRRQVQTGAH